jgi:hypothetical protein
MSKKIPDAVVDLPLDKIATSTQMHLLAAEPADRAAVLAGSLGFVAVVSGDFSKSSVSGGRKLTVASKTITPTAAGSATHLALIDGSALLLVNIGATQAVSVGVPVVVQAFDLTQAYPV